VNPWDCDDEDEDAPAERSAGRRGSLRDRTRQRRADTTEGEERDYQDDPDTMTRSVGEGLPQEAIDSVRRNRVVTAAKQGDGLIGTQVDDEPPPLVPLDPRAAHERGLDMVLKSFLDDPIRFGLLCDMVRVQHPELKLFSDSQLTSIVRALYDTAMRGATDEAFRRLGRGKELQIKTGGF